jgi:hypothetical protein
MAQAVMMSNNQLSTDVADSYRQQALLSRPELKKLTKLDLEMAAALSRTDLTTNQKMLHFQEVLNRFRNVRNDILQNGSTLPPPPPPPPTPEPVNPPADDAAAVDAGPNFMELLQQLMDAKGAVKQAKKSKKNKKQQGATAAKKRKTAGATAAGYYDTDVSDDGFATPVGASPQVPATPKGLSKAPAVKLHNMLARQAGIRFDEDEKTVQFKDQVIDDVEWSKAVNYMTQKSQPGIGATPQHVKKLAADILDYVMENTGEDMQDFSKQHVVIRQHVLGLKRKKRTPKRMKQTGMGGFVDNASWDANL